MGPVRVTMQELYVSFISSIIILPLNLLIDQLFRRSRPKSHKTDLLFAKPSPKPETGGGDNGQGQKADEDNLRAIRSRLFQVMECPEVTLSSDDADLKKANATSIDQHKGKTEDSSHTSQLNNKTQEAEGRDSKRKEGRAPRRKRGRVMLPHWCVYVAWVLVAAVSGVSIFITFSYSMEWGKEKSLAWLSAMFMSVFQSVLLVQPFKVSKPSSGKVICLLGV